MFFSVFPLQLRLKDLHLGPVFSGVDLCDVKVFYVSQIAVSL